MHVLSTLLLFAAVCTAVPTVRTYSMRGNEAAHFAETASLIDARSFIEDSNAEITAVGAKIAMRDDNSSDQALAKRDGMYTGKQYQVAGWVFSVGAFIVEELGGTAWRFPQDGPSVEFIATQVASSITQTLGGGKQIKEVGCGWSWQGTMLGSNYVFNQIPYEVLYATVVDAINGATSWITVENAFMFILNDTNGRAILELYVGPTVNNGVESNYHEEF